MPLSVAWRFQHVHADDQSINEPIAVAHLGIGDQIAGARIVDYLTDVDGDASVGLLGEALWLDLAGNRCELSAPVVADRRAADYPTAFPCVGPVDVGMHQVDSGLDIARVERSVRGSQD